MAETVETLNPRIDPNQFFPDIKAVSETLFAGSLIERPSIDDYAISLEATGRLTPAVEEALQRAREIRSSTEAIVYIAGPLTGVSEELKLRYQQVSDLLASYDSIGGDKATAFFGYAPHLFGTDPVKHPDVSAQEVRDVDYLWAFVVADFHVNFFNPTAHGNAIELGWAERALIPTLPVNERGNQLSRLTLGMHNLRAGVTYKDFDTDGVEGLRQSFDEIHAWMAAFPDRNLRDFHYLDYGIIGKPLLKLAGIDLTSDALSHVDELRGYVADSDHKLYGQSGLVVARDVKSQRLVLEASGTEHEVDPKATKTILWRDYPIR